jgi:hypothetical protein
LYNPTARRAGLKGWKSIDMTASSQGITISGNLTFLKE